MDHAFVFAIVIEKQNVCQDCCWRVRSFHDIENIEISAKTAMWKSYCERRRLLIYQEFPDISGIFLTAFRHKHSPKQLEIFHLVVNAQYSGPDLFYISRLSLPDKSLYRFGEQVDFYRLRHVTVESRLH